MAFIYDLTDTWNAGGTTFNAIKMNVTDTASAAASKLITVQVGGSEKFGVRKDGQGYFAGNLGVGTSSPATALDVVGAGTFKLDGAGSTTPLILRNNNTSSVQSVKLGFDSNGAIKASINAAVYGNDYMTFNVGSDTERMRITSAGLVGIGTTAPATQLHIAAASSSAYARLSNNSGIFYAGVKSTGEGYVSTESSDPLTFATVGSERMRITSAGLVGIGTSSPGQKLTVAGNIELFQGADRFIKLGSSTNYNYTLSAVGDDFQILEAGTTPRLTIKYPNGNLGIGTSSPGAKLDVVGDISVSGNENYLNLSSSATVGDNIRARIRAVGSGGGSGYGGDFRVSTRTPSNTWNTDALVVDSSGNVGIGTSSPADLLHVKGSTAAVSDYQIIAEGVVGGYGAGVSFQSQLTGGSLAEMARITADGEQPWNTTASTQDAGLRFHTSLDGTVAERMRITSAGLVGIGTSSPSLPLVVSNAGAGGLEFNHSGAIGNGTSIQSYNRSTAAYIPNTNYALSQTWYSGATRAMDLDSSGNLLVGTTSASDTTTTDGLALRGDFPGYIVSRRSSGAGQGHMAFVNGGATVGSIVSSTTATTYNTSSDYRLKDIDGPIANSGSYIDALKPVQGSWKADGSRFIGLLAHEVQEVSETQIATSEKDGEEMQAMDYSAPEIIANLIAEVQQLRARVAQLEG